MSQASVPTVIAQGTSPPQIALYKRMGAIGCELRIVADAAEAARLLDERAGDALLLPLDEGGRAALERLSPEQRRQVIVLAEKMSADGLRTLASLEVGAVLAKSGAFTAEELLAAVLKHLKADLFGIEKYLGWGTQPHRLRLTDSTRRGEMLDELEQFLNQLGLDNRLIGQTLTMTDELVTNALYNAPVDASGRRQFAHLSRIDPIEVAADRAVELSYGCDGQLFAVGVRDSYGTLEPARVLQQIAKAIEGPARVSFDSAGAGIGLITAFHSASQLVFNLDQRQASECIGLIEIGSYKQFLEQGKSVHVFSLFNSGQKA